MMERVTAGYLRLNQRERVMTLAVAAILFLLINIFLWRMVLGSIANSGRELAARKSTRAEQVVYMKERELWAKREEWLEKTQPILKGAEETSNLLEQVKQVASKYNVLIENPAKPLRIIKPFSLPLKRAVIGPISSIFFMTFNNRTHSLSLKR
jgi:hypothetical protein